MSVIRFFREFAKTMQRNLWGKNMFCFLFYPTLQSTKTKAEYGDL
nr:MAG TPA: hypothetical protein [Bacteriophage sp.]DAY54688.1 MAG TPA: hypothetical protein [Caudoviricetes sp.]